MAKSERRVARKPATKFPNLRKKLQKGKIQSRQAKKKCGISGDQGFSFASRPIPKPSLVSQHSRFG